MSDDALVPPRTTTLILGGGFGGIATANTLRGLLPAEHEIVVIDDSPRFLVGAGKTWIMLGERTYDQISRPRESLLVPGVRLVQSRVEAIGLADRTVSSGEATLHWDHLVVALGAELNRSKVPGLAETAHTFYNVEGAQRLKVELERFAGGDLAILIPKAPFKCPPAPYEAAMLLHDAFLRRGNRANVRLAMYTVEGAPMATAGPEMGQYIKSELALREIAFHPQKATSRVDAATRRVIFEDGSEARYDLLVTVPPHEAPSVVHDANLTNPSGWIPVDPLTLQVKLPPGTKDVYAIGDVTTVPLPGRYKPDVGLSLPKAGVMAEQQGRVVAQRIAARVFSQTPSATFDGTGFCFLETGEGRAVRAEGSFFELPHPVMKTRLPDEAQLRDKFDWIDGLLRPMR
jgi:sulfide:quinone oxidoreductase